MPIYIYFLFVWQCHCHWLMFIDANWCWLTLIDADWFWLMLPFCEVYPAYTSSKLCEFVVMWIIPVIFWRALLSDLEQVGSLSRHVWCPSLIAAPPCPWHFLCLKNGNCRGERESLHMRSRICPKQWYLQELSTKPINILFLKSQMAQKS